MLPHLGIVGFHIFHPGRAAAGKLRYGPVPLRETFHQLAGLFHYGHVRREIGVQHIIGAQPAQQGHHFPLDKAAVRHAELLAQRRPDGRGCAAYHNFIRVCHSPSHILVFILLRDTSGGTDISALPAMDTNCSIPCQLQIITACNPDAFRADILTLAAFDTFRLIPDD